MSNFVIDTDYREWSPHDISAPPGTYILRAEHNEALLDLDTQDQVNQFVKNLSIVDRWWPVKSVRIWKSKDTGVHAALKWIKPPSNIRLIQAALGSDPVREILNLLDTEKMGLQLNVLFKPADEVTLKALAGAEENFIDSRRLEF